MTRRTTGVAPDAFPEVLAAARLGQPWAFEALYRGYAGPPPPPSPRTSSARSSPPSSPASPASPAPPTSSGGCSRSRSAGSSTTCASAHGASRRRRTTRTPTTASSAAPSWPRSTASASSGSRRVLDRLAPDQRDVLLLRILGDLTVEQVTQALGKSKGAVEQVTQALGKSKGAVKQLQRRALAAAGRIRRGGGRTPVSPAGDALTDMTWTPRHGRSRALRDADVAALLHGTPPADRPDLAAAAALTTALREIPQDVPVPTVVR